MHGICKLLLAVLALGAALPAAQAQQSNVVSASRDVQPREQSESQGAGSRSACRRSRPASAPRRLGAGAASPPSLSGRLGPVEQLISVYVSQTKPIIPRAARFAYAAKRGLCWCGQMAHALHAYVCACMRLAPKRPDQGAPTHVPPGAGSLRMWPWGPGQPRRSGTSRGGTTVSKLHKP